MVDLFTLVIFVIRHNESETEDFLQSPKNSEFTNVEKYPFDLLTQSSSLPESIKILTL